MEKRLTNWALPGRLGIDRAHYAALAAPEPAAAAEFAERYLGFSLVHVDSDGRHYLAGHGLDRYSLVYVPGEMGLDHLSFLVRSPGALLEAEDALVSAGIQVQRVEDSGLWHHEPSIRFTHSTGETLELTTGVNVASLMHWEVQAPKAVTAPLTCDHAILRAVDVEAANIFDAEVMGLKESGRIVAPDEIPILTFFRAHTLYHCFGTARSNRSGLHHVAFTLKNDKALFRAHEAISSSGGVEMLWGPVRHGAGGNIAFYFRDQVGHIIEFTAEEEVILNDETYLPDAWPVSVVRASDEWGTHPPESMKG